ncbi:MAG: phage portal protein [Desulfovibrio sp.]
MAVPTLVDRFGRPFATPASGRMGGVSRVAGSHRGTLAGWWPRRNTDSSASRERDVIARRAEDLAANDAHAAGLIGGMGTNVVGTGIKPQSQVEAAALGLTDEDAVSELRDQIEAAFSLWAMRADAGGRMTFDMLQALNIRTTLIQGEFCNLCVNMADAGGGLPPGRHFSMALQSVSPQRIQSPFGQWYSPDVHDGVKLGAFGEPAGYWIAQPDMTGNIPFGQSLDTRYYPASIAHRPVVLHAFPQTDPEQFRGRSILAPAMKFFRDLNDCLDYELVGQLVTAAFPVAITSDNSALFNATGQLPPGIRFRPEEENVSEVSAGSVLQLFEGEDIKALESKRPGNNFDPFVTRILRAAGAAAGIPYEVVVKDFSQTNYSSARAALLEAQRVFRCYQQWLIVSFCQRVWRAVVEEAFVRGMVKIPQGAPDFYDAMDAYLAVSWIPPRPGHVDPTKETAAEIAAIEAGIATYADVIAARGGDYENTFRQRKREQDLARKLGLSSASASTATSHPVPENEPEEETFPQRSVPEDQEAAASAARLAALERLRPYLASDETHEVHA